MKPVPRSSLVVFHALRELALVVAAYLLYFGVRGMTEGNPARAVEHARDLVDLERALRIYWEPVIQSLVIDDHRLVTLVNWVYVWGHWPVIVAAGLWLCLRRPRTYLLFRNAFLISGAIGLVIFMTFPVAPPRLADLGVVDTVDQYSHAYRVLQPPAFVNQYAAVPSLHFGWNLLIGIALFRQSSRPVVRVFAVVMPGLMLLAIVATANHYILDAAAGAAVALLGLALAHYLRLPALHARPPQRSAPALGARTR